MVLTLTAATLAAVSLISPLPLPGIPVPVLLLVGLVWLIVRAGNSASRVLPAPTPAVVTLPPPAPV